MKRNLITLLIGEQSFSHEMSVEFPWQGKRVYLSFPLS
jgi:hypothetical protein